MSVLADVARYARFARGLRDLLRHPISLQEAQEIVRRRIAEREANFLRLAERAIFGYPRSPYRSLLRLAGCEMADIQRMVRTTGLEATLRALRDAGVYVTFEEFKCRVPIARGGQTIHVAPRDFDNPLLNQYVEASSGGTTGAQTGLLMDLTNVAARAPQIMLAYDAHGILGVPTAIWRGILPDSGGISSMLRGALIGHIPEKWFLTTAPQDLRPNLKNRLLTQYIVTLGRLYGLRIPRPEPVSLDQALVVARWAAETLAARGACLIRCHVSMAVRVCIAAREQGLNLRGVTFMGGGEPPTPAKVREILRVGARWIPAYAFSELGQVGLGCGRPADGSDVHFLKDAVALIQCPRQVPGWSLSVDAFYFTSLLPTAPKVLMNVENDDYGVVETRSCGCPLETYGYTEHIRDVRSFRKLTSEGITLVGGDMIHILEEVLPSRFGGSPLDYQLLEEEDEQGFTRLFLVVSPKVPIADEAEVVETVMGALGTRARAIWKQAETLRVRRMEPIWTGRGKLMPLNLARRSERSVDAAKE